MATNIIKYNYRKYVQVIFLYYRTFIIHSHKKIIKKSFAFCL